MRLPDDAAELSSAQAAAAVAGMKSMIPFERPFLDYVLASVADAGFRSACIVVGPGHGALVDHCRASFGGLLRLSFAVQPEPLGTADALLAAEASVESEEFLCLNGDNCYPASALRSLREAGGCATIGFDRDALLRAELSLERLGAFAVLETDSEGWLCGVREKPGAEKIARMPAPAPISMNCWRFGPAIFTACRRIGRSPRGELEIPCAVMHSIHRLGQRYRVIPSDGEVLDLTVRADVSRVASRLKAEVRT